MTAVDTSSRVHALARESAPAPALPQRARYAQQSGRRAAYKQQSATWRAHLLDRCAELGVAPPDDATMRSAVWLLIVGPTFIKHGKRLKIRKGAITFLRALSAAERAADPSRMVPT